MPDEATAGFIDDNRQAGRLPLHMDGGAPALDQLDPAKIHRHPGEGERAPPLQRHELGDPMMGLGVEMMDHLIDILSDEGLAAPRRCRSAGDGLVKGGWLQILRVHGAAYCAYGLFKKAYRRIVLPGKASGAALEKPSRSGW
jgi:hypothetical protein